MVMYVDVDCIYFHSFVLGIREDGEQRGIRLGDGPYSISTNSSSFYVSAMSDKKKIQFSMGDKWWGYEYLNSVGLVGIGF